MKLDTKAFTLTVAIVWGGAVLMAGITNLIWNGYAVAFLALVASIYPGYDGLPTAWSIAVATLYAVIDGVFGGLVIAVIYNRLAGGQEDAKRPVGVNI